MTNFLLALTISFGPFFVGGQDQQAPVPQDVDIVGVYQCQGVGPGGPYQGIVKIEKNGDTYWLQWTLSEENIISLGLGIIKGNILAVSYFGEMVGVASYKIEGVGLKLIGEWATISADGKVYPETLTKFPPGTELPEFLPLPQQRKQQPALPAKIA